ncbi:MAG: hypothetical protein DRN68_08825 [Thaumarchaeota archaeon]|nr:MAG: hypothetical protein DRN68_08825 [Nitrososphaerota archaeon]
MYKPVDVVKVEIGGRPKATVGVEIRDPGNKLVLIYQIQLEGNALLKVLVFVIDVFRIKHTATADDEDWAVLEDTRGDVKVVTECLEEKVFADEGTKIGLELPSKARYEYILAALILGIFIGLILDKILFKPKIEKENEQS